MVEPSSAHVNSQGSECTEGAGTTEMPKQLHPAGMDGFHTESPVARLSPELLLEIIKLYINMGSDFRKTWAYPLITATHVCRYWRDVAISYGPFWGKIIISRPDRVREWLLRSKQTPLVIITAGIIPDAEAAESYRLILQHVSRLRVMQLYATPLVVQLFVSSGWADCPAPLLREMILSSDQTGSGAGPILAENFMPRHALQLEHLNLSTDEAIDWRIAQLPSKLKSFHTSGLFSTASLHAMFSCIETLPELQRIQFFLQFEGVFRAPKRYILPPHLKSFLLGNLLLDERTSTADAFIPLLDCFSFPPTTSVYIALDYDDPGPPGSLRTLAASVVRALHGEHHGPINPILSLAFDPYGFRVYAWTSLKSLDQLADPTYADKCPPRLALTLYHGDLDDDENQTTLFDALCSMLPILDIQVLYLEFSGHQDGESLHTTLRDFFGNITRLKALRIAMLDGPDLLTLLAGDVDDSSPLPHDQSAFLGLETLELEMIEFSDTENDLCLFTQWLQARQATDAKLTTLAFMTCGGVEPQYIQSLKGVVPEIVYVPRR